MDASEALEFLAEHQPMPPDTELDEDLIRRFDDAWRVLRDHPDPRAPRLLLNAFGDGDGWGVYQLVDEGLRAQSRELVVDALCDSLLSPHPGVRSWSAELASDFPDTRLDPIMASLLGSSDYDERFWAASYLADRRVVVDRQLVENARTDADDDLLAVLNEIRVQKSSPGDS
jgi:hypothetical protein